MHSLPHLIIGTSCENRDGWRMWAVLPSPAATAVKMAVCSLNVKQDNAEAECQNCDNTDVPGSIRFA